MRGIFWTGGWDSTFRVLELIITKKKEVQPYYLIPPKRLSSKLELETIQKIRNQLAIDFPEALERLAPLKIFRADDIEKDTDIINAQQKFQSSVRDFSTQYHWIARFVKYQQIGQIEMSFNYDDTPRKLLSEFVESENDTLQISDRFSHTPEFTLFRWFNFPQSLWNRTKCESINSARESGFLAILEQSWFCHFPIQNQACGQCTPCRQAIEGGMGYRLPWRARYLRYPIRRFERWLLQTLSPTMIARLRSLKQRIGA